MITPVYADAIWTVLVVVCGADETERDDFIFAAGTTDQLEYHFETSHVWSGTVYCDDVPRVAARSDNADHSSRLQVQAANELLTAIARLRIGLILQESKPNGDENVACR